MAFSSIFVDYVRENAIFPPPNFWCFRRFLRPKRNFFASEHACQGLKMTQKSVCLRIIEQKLRPHKNISPCGHGEPFDPFKERGKDVKISFSLLHVMKIEKVDNRAKPFL